MILECIVAAFFILVSGVILFLCVKSGLREDIWFDEVFSMRFLEKSYGEIAALTAADVHPPLYYWYLKGFHDLFHMILPGVPSPVLAKMASVLPFIGVWVYALTLVRKRMGILVSAVFLFFVSSMPQILNYSVEIRMYSLALFMITACFLHGYEIILENKKRNWLAFLLYGIATAYTQYYACIAIMAVYLALFAYFAITKQKNQLLMVLGCGAVSVVFYLPWIPVLISQITTVNSNYWIQPLTFRSIFGCIKFIFMPSTYYVGMKNYLYAVVMIGIFGLAFLYGIWKEKNARTRYLLLGGIFIPVFVAFMGFVCSALNRPIFVYRYLVPGLGAMWLVAAYVLLKYRREWIVLLLLIPFVMAGRYNVNGFYSEEVKKVENMEMTEAFLEAFPKDAVILCNFNHVQATAAYYLDNEIVLYGGEPEALIQTLEPNCVGLLQIENLPDLVKEKDVYFFGSFEAREALLEEWAQYGISYTEEGTFLLERYWFNVYHLKYENQE